MTKPAINKIAMNFIDVHFMGTLSCALEIMIYLVYLKNASKRRDFPITALSSATEEILKTSYSKTPW
jgi:hypothetical protein